MSNPRQNGKASQRDKSAAKLIRIELLKRDWTPRDLAEKTGYTSGTLSNIVCGNERSVVMRRKVEIALQVPVWTDPAEFYALIATNNPDSTATPTK